MSHQPVRYRRSAEILERSFGGHVLVTLPEQEDVELLSGTAASVWLLLAAPGRTPEEIARRLARDFAATPETVQADVERLLKELAHRGWIAEIPDGDA